MESKYSQMKPYGIKIFSNETHERFYISKTKAHTSTSKMLAPNQTEAVMDGTSFSGSTEKRSGVQTTKYMCGQLENP